MNFAENNNNSTSDNETLKRLGVMMGKGEPFKNRLFSVYESGMYNLSKDELPGIQETVMMVNNSLKGMAMVKADGFAIPVSALAKGDLDLLEKNFAITKTDYLFHNADKTPQLKHYIIDKYGCTIDIPNTAPAILLHKKITLLNKFDSDRINKLLETNSSIGNVLGLSSVGVLLAGTAAIVFAPVTIPVSAGIAAATLGLVGIIDSSNTSLKQAQGFAIKDGSARNDSPRYIGETPEPAALMHDLKEFKKSHVEDIKNQISATINVKETHGLGDRVLGLFFKDENKQKNNPRPD